MKAYGQPGLGIGRECVKDPVLSFLWEKLTVDMLGYVYYEIKA